MRKAVLDMLYAMMQVWKTDASILRLRADDYPGVAEHYHSAANHLGQARHALQRAILEESAVEE